MYSLRKSCRSCNYAHPGPGGTKSPVNEKLIPVMDLGIQPLANDWCGPEDERGGYAPLQVLWCPKCSLAQLSVTVRPEILYQKYLYQTSDSRMMRAHFDSLLADIKTECDPESVVEIASNDGLFLDYLFNHGIRRVAGIEPATNLVEMSRGRGIQTFNAFFNRDSSVTAKVTLGQVDLVVARHVFCHIDDWQDFIHNLVELTDKNTLVCIEVPWVVDMIKSNSFDQIYHEHLSYLSVKSMHALLQGTPLHIHRVRHYPIHGGAIVLMLRRNDCTMPPNPSVQSFMDKEDIDLECWKGFRGRTEILRMELSKTVYNLVSEGKTVVGLGASAKSTVWMNSCGFNRSHIRFVCDSTLSKQWKLCPGTDVPVTDEGAILRELPNYVILFAWNFALEILEKNKLAREKGVKFIIPVPELKIV